MDLTATVVGLSVNIPDASQVSNGIQSVFVGVGATETFTVKDADGGTIVTVSSGEAWVVYLTDNSTSAGVWRFFELGAGTSTANAASLVGAGLQATGSILEQIVAPTSTSSVINWDDTDRATLTIWIGGTGTLNLPDPGVVESNWFAMIRNEGTGELSIIPPSGTIDSAVSLTLSQAM